MAKKPTISTFRTLVSRRIETLKPHNRNLTLVPGKGMLKGSPEILINPKGLTHPFKALGSAPWLGRSLLELCIGGGAPNHGRWEAEEEGVWQF